MTDRQIPRWSELRPLLRTKPFVWNSKERRVSRAFSIADLREIARRRTPRSVFDYTDGAADAEISLRRARQAFENLEFRPSVLRDVGGVDTTTTMLGKQVAMPFGFAATGFTRMMNHEGESAVARVAERAGIPYGLSTLGTTSIEDVTAAAPNANKWFQLYVSNDRSMAEDLVERAGCAGFEALILTVDVPVSGSRLRDSRNGFSIPPTLTLKTIADGAMHPAWWLNLLTTRPLEFATFQSWDGTVAELLNALLDPTMTIEDLNWLRSLWTGPLVVKGVQTVDDAKRIVDAGADAIVLSNHAGRQLDRAPVPLELLPDVVKAVGSQTEVYVDTGITTGADIAAAVALGAQGCFVGRAYLYGLMAAGERGVARATEILASELRRTMQLLGATSVADLNPSHVRIKPR